MFSAALQQEYFRGGFFVDLRDEDTLCNLPCVSQSPSKLHRAVACSNIFRLLRNSIKFDASLIRQVFYHCTHRSLVCKGGDSKLTRPKATEDIFNERSIRLASKICFERCIAKLVLGSNVDGVNVPNCCAFMLYPQGANIQSSRWAPGTIRSSPDSLAALRPSLHLQQRPGVE